MGQGTKIPHAIGRGLKENVWRAGWHHEGARSARKSHSSGLGSAAQDSLPFPWLHDGNNHPSGALGETNHLASSSTGIAERLLCAHHHVQVGGEDRCPPSGALLCNAWGKGPCPQSGPLSFLTLVTTICNLSC